MSLRTFLSWLRDTTLRTFPHATRPGLRRIGNPGPEDPVLVTGNFTLTVRRVFEALAGRNAWLLVANSRGINVWCAAGGGHMTHHDIIAAVRSSGVNDVVNRRRLILPQLGATGIERRRITDATGWETAWGPARLEDLAPFLERGARVKRGMRTMTFPMWERAEMAIMWGVPMLVPAAIGMGLAAGVLAAAVGAAALLFTVGVLFLATPVLPVSRPVPRWLVCLGFGAACLSISAAALWTMGALTATAGVALAVTSGVGFAVLALDFTGSTPFWPGGINTLGNHFDIELVEQRCTGAADCVLVCPREVLVMDGPRRKVAVVRPDDCIRCGACIVQCPEDALRFRFADGRVVEAAQVRKTRLNLLGRRTVQVAEH